MWTQLRWSGFSHQSSLTYKPNERRHVPYYPFWKYHKDKKKKKISKCFPIRYFSTFSRNPRLRRSRPYLNQKHIFPKPYNISNSHIFHTNTETKEVKLLILYLKQKLAKAHRPLIRLFMSEFLLFFLLLTTLFPSVNIYFDFLFWLLVLNR